MEEKTISEDPCSRIPSLRKLFDQKRTWIPMWYPTADYDPTKIVRFEINSNSKINKPVKNKSSRQAKSLHVTLLHNAGTTCFMVCIMHTYNVNVFSMTHQCLQSMFTGLECSYASAGENTNV